MSFNLHQLGLAPPMLAVKPDKPGLILPSITGATATPTPTAANNTPTGTSNGGTNNQQQQQQQQHGPISPPSASRVLAQQQQQQQQQGSSLVSPRISIAIRPRASTTVTEPTQTNSAATPSPILTNPTPSHRASSTTPISIPIRRASMRLSGGPLAIANGNVAHQAEVPTPTDKSDEKGANDTYTPSSGSDGDGRGDVHRRQTSTSVSPLDVPSDPSAAQIMVLPDHNTPIATSSPSPPASSNLPTPPRSGDRSNMSTPRSHGGSVGGGVGFSSPPPSSHGRRSSTTFAPGSMTALTPTHGGHPPRTPTPTHAASTPNNNSTPHNTAQMTSPQNPSLSSSTAAPTPAPPTYSSSPSIFTANNSSVVLSRMGSGVGSYDNLVMCDVCEIHMADVHCNECAINLCTSNPDGHTPGGCNRSTHHASVKLRSHQRVPLVAGVPDADHANRPSTGVAGMRPGSSMGGRASMDGTAVGLTSVRRSTGRSSMLGGFSPIVTSQLSPSASPSHSSASPALTAGRAPSPATLPPPAMTTPTTVAPHAKTRDLSASPPGGDGDGGDDYEDDEEDDTDAVARAKEAHVASLVGPSCDQCHLASAHVFCIDCMSSLCDPAATGGDASAGCNKRIHKARAMARHRQVRIEQREEILAQMEQEEEAQQMVSSPGPSSHRLSATSPPSGAPRQSFIAPLASHGRSSLGGGLLHTSSSPSPSSSSSNSSSTRQPHVASPPFSPFVSPAHSSSSNGPTPRSSRHSLTNMLLTPTHRGSMGGSGGQTLSTSPKPMLTPTPPPAANTPTHGLANENHAHARRGSRAARLSLSGHTPLLTGAIVDDPPHPPESPSHSSDVSLPTPTSPPPEALAAAAAVAPQKPCDNCDEQLAVCYCHECRLFLCTAGQCQQLIHRPNKMKTHQIFLIAGTA